MSNTKTPSARMIKRSLFPAENAAVAAAVEGLEGLTRILHASTAQLDALVLAGGVAPPASASKTGSASERLASLARSVTPSTDTPPPQESVSGVRRWDAASVKQARELSSLVLTLTQAIPERAALLREMTRSLSQRERGEALGKQAKKRAGQPGGAFAPRGSFPTKPERDDDAADDAGADRAGRAALPDAHPGGVGMGPIAEVSVESRYPSPQPAGTYPARCHSETDATVDGVDSEGYPEQDATRS